MSICTACTRFSSSFACAITRSAMETNLARIVGNILEIRSNVWCATSVLLSSWSLGDTRNIMLRGVESNRFVNGCDLVWYPSDDAYGRVIHTNCARLVSLQAD